jgi:signal transduction histidine kinase
VSALSAPRLPPPRGIVALIAPVAVAGFVIPWYSPAPPSLVWLVLWELTVGTGFAVAGCLVAASLPRSVPAALLVLAALLLYAAAAVAGPDSRLSEALWTLVVLAVVPLGLLRVLPHRPFRTALGVGDVLVAACGVLAAAGVFTHSAWVTGVPALGGAVLLLLAGWLLFECTAGDDRRRVLWLILGCAVCVPTTLLLLVSLDTTRVGGTIVVAVAMATVALALPAAMAVALLDPRRFDVRELISRVSVLVVMFALTLAVYQGGEAAVQSLTGAPAGRALRLILVLAVAAGFHPTMRWIRGSLDEMLFGRRPDPVDTLTRLGSQLTAGSTPAEWLETLRAAVGVPALVLRGDGAQIAVAGTPADSPTATTELRAGAEHVGDLVVTLPDDALRLPPTTAAVLALLAPPLAQALYADRLAEQLRASRGRVVAALEEERRRMRRDLHDGLGPTLTGIAYGADAAGNLVASDPDEARAVLRTLRGDAGEAIAEVRRIVYGLRPRALDELGLVGAVRQQVSHLRTAGGGVLTVDVQAPPAMPELPAAVEVAAYRVAVEAVTNVARHAGVAAATVAFALDAAVLRVSVSDTGAGPGGWQDGVGVTSMRERVEQIGGTLTISAGPTGCTVTAAIPLDVP